MYFRNYRRRARARRRRVGRTRRRRRRRARRRRRSWRAVTVGRPRTRTCPRMSTSSVATERRRL